MLITGTTSGTGRIAARTMAKLGATLVCLNRPSERANKALEELKSEFSEADIRLIAMDLQDFESVKAGIEEIKSAFTKINVICCNAGVMAVKDAATKDGYDVQMQTNHLSHFLLVKELYSLLEEAAQTDGEARVVNHSSGARNYPTGNLKPEYFGKNGGSLGGNGSSMICGGARWVRYKQTKLANSVFTTAMQKRLTAKGSKVMALCAHPGLAATDLQATTNKDGGLGSSFTNCFMSFSQSAEDGTCGIVKCMADKDVIAGGMYGPKGATGPAVIQSHGPYNNEAGETLLWEASEEAVGKFVI